MGNDATVLGFVGLPFTLATYMVEGKSSQEYLEIKKLAHTEPAVLHQMLTRLAENIGAYACYMADSGAQIIQIFDSWAATLSPRGAHTWDCMALQVGRDCVFLKV